MFIFRWSYVTQCSAGKFALETKSSFFVCIHSRRTSSNHWTVLLFKPLQTVLPPGGDCIYSQSPPVHPSPSPILESFYTCMEQSWKLWQCYKRISVHSAGRDEVCKVVPRIVCWMEHKDDSTSVVENVYDQKFPTCN
jgi:hypothetical protein